MKDTEENQEKGYSVLVVGLGNREVTPDALGPYVVDQLNVTRHIVQEYGRYAVGKGGSRIVSAIVPGVMAQTGMESAEIIRGIVNETTPDLIMVIDALAARSTKRLNRMREFIREQGLEITEVRLQKIRWEFRSLQSECRQLWMRQPL